jgi:DNA-binding transcriptional LysR family regulator
MILSKALLIFLAVAEQGSFSKAGQQLYLSPVAVMKQMNTFEHDIGVPLFARSKRGTDLTPAGKKLYADAQKLKALADQAVQQVQAMSRNQPTPIRVGTSLLRSCAPLISLWSYPSALKANFQIEVVPFTDDGIGLNQLLTLLGTEIDCFISPYDTLKLKQEFNIQSLGHYVCQIGVPLQNPLAKKSHLTWQDLQDQSLLLLKSGESETIDAMRNEIAMRHLNIKIHDLNRFYDLDSFNHSVQNNQLIEAIEPWKTVHPNLRFLPMDWHYQIPYGLVYSKKPSPQVQQFIQATYSLNQRTLSK